MKTRPCGVLVIMLALGSACAPTEPASTSAPMPLPPPPAPVVAPLAPIGAPVTDRGSLYDLDIQLEDHADREIHLDVFRSHVTLVSMFYSSCPAACPTLISDLRRIDAALSDAEKRDVRVLLISMDRDKDSPASFRALAEKHGIDLSLWTLAEPEHEADVRAVAAALNIKYRKLPDGNISHSTIVTILRRDGGLDLAVEGLARDNADIIARLQALVAAAPN